MISKTDKRFFIMKKILSFGGGVNTMALLALAKLSKIKFDYIIFADTGVEWPETYTYIKKIVKPLCHELQIPFVTVKNKEPMYDYFWRYKFIPLRYPRICTVKFKIELIKKWLFNNFTDFEVIIGISYEEKHRAGGGIDYPVSYPLVEMKINRKECKKIIRQVGLPVPPKSGCYICPFQRISQWRDMWDRHPELFLKAEALEKNSKKYPDNLLARIPLEKLRKRRDYSVQTGLDGGFACVMCHL